MTPTEQQLMTTLLDIFVLAKDCRSAMRARVSDEDSRRVYAVLAAIEQRASEVIHHLNV